jgi:hypothetical protein
MSWIFNMKRGRKNTFSAPLRSAVTSARSTLTPPQSLTKPERTLFLEIVSTHPHLKAGDATMLAHFARASIKYEAFAKANDVGSWEKAGRLVLALARGLRLLPAMHSRTLARSREAHRPNFLAQWLADNPDPNPEEGDDDTDTHIH